MGMRRSEWPAFQRRARVRRLDTAGIQGVSIFSVLQDARKRSAESPVTIFGRRGF